jgi:hypothetical protein
MRARDVRRPDGRRRDAVPQRHAHRREVELLLEHRDGAVGRAVADDDDLVSRIAESEERADAVDDHGLLVEGGHDHGHARRERRPEDLVERQVSACPQLRPHVPPGERREEEVQPVQDEEVEELRSHAAGAVGR